MKYVILAYLKRIIAILTAFCLRFGLQPATPARPADNTVAAYDAAAADYLLDVDAGNALYDISDLLFGVFFEDINFAADGGLYAEMVANRSFEYTALAAGDALYGWTAVGAAKTEVLQNGAGLNENNPSFLRLTNPTAVLAGIENRGFMEGMAIEAGADYRLTLYARSADASAAGLRIGLMAGTQIAAAGEITGITGDSP